MPKVEIDKTTTVRDLVFFRGTAHVTDEHKKLLKSDEAVEVGTDPQATEDLKALSVTELKKRAKEAGIKGYSSMNEDELVAALEQEK